MKALAIRLKNLVFRPLWTETARHKARRRLQLLVSMPFVLLGGVIWGAFAAPIIGQGSAFLWSMLGASVFGLFFYLEQKLLPVVAALADRFGLGALAALAWEVGIVGGLIFLATSVMGAPVVQGVALAIGVGVLYSLTFEYFVLGSGPSHMLNLLGLGRGFSGAGVTDYSYAQALEKRGELERAAEIYKDTIRTNRRDPTAYLRLASIRTRSGLHEEAIDILRRGLAVARFSPMGKALAVREIHEISSKELGNPARAAPDLVRYLEGGPQGEHEEWARHELAEIKQRIREEG